MHPARNDAVDRTTTDAEIDRSVAGVLVLNREPRVRAYVVEAENFESIHNHSAFARVVSRRDHDTVGACATLRQRNLRQLPTGGTA